MNNKNTMNIVIMLTKEMLHSSITTCLSFLQSSLLKGEEDRGV